MPAMHEIGYFSKILINQEIDAGIISTPWIFAYCWQERVSAILLYFCIYIEYVSQVKWKHPILSTYVYIVVPI